MRYTRLIASTVAMLLAHVALAGETLSWQEMASRPELWPKEVTVKVEMNFQGGAGVAAGQRANVEQVKASEIDLVTQDGKLNFAADPDETDALAVANAAYAKLTAKQRELTYASIAKQKELWPERVALTKTLTPKGGQPIPAGEQVVVQDVQAERVTVLVEKIKTIFQVAPYATDLMAQARTFVEDPKAGGRFLAAQQQKQQAQTAAVEKKAADDKEAAATRLLKEMDGHLVNSVTGKPDALDPAAMPKYFVFVRGSSTCPYTRKFAPSVVKYYDQTKPAHPEFEVIWLMCDSPEETGKFAKQLGFSWRAIDYESQPKVPEMNNQIEGRLPQLFVMDAAGHTLANGVRDDAPAALKKLDAMLKRPAAGTAEQQQQQQ